ncbi:MAG: hypothetical protein KKD18_06370, partial [Nanoarchaeota archaeon]|nr:hypothetical protein [Nanoarchaeota archaeon]
SSDLSPIYTHNGMKYYETGDKRRPKDNEYWASDSSPGMIIQHRWEGAKRILAPIPTITKEEPKMKYEATDKELTPKAFFEAVPEHEKNCAKFWEDMGFLVAIAGGYLGKILISVIEPEFWQRLYLKRYLLVLGFIREGKEPEPEVFYHLGQCFKDGYGDKCMITAADTLKINMTDLEDGKMWNGPVSVENMNKITQAEFDLLGRRFTPIPGT